MMNWIYLLRSKKNTCKKKIEETRKITVKISKIMAISGHFSQLILKSPQLIKLTLLPMNKILSTSPTTNNSESTELALEQHLLRSIAKTCLYTNILTI